MGTSTSTTSGPTDRSCWDTLSRPSTRPRAAQLELGNLLSLNHPLHVQFAERLVARFAGAEMAAFFKTGSEATTAALRIARAATGRQRVVRCGYHGWHDWCLPVEPFVPKGLAEQVLELDARAPESLDALLSSVAHEVARGDRRSGNDFAQPSQRVSRVVGDHAATRRGVRSG